MTAPLLPGDSAPPFRAPVLGGAAEYAFDTAAGRPALLLFLGSARLPGGPEALAAVARRRALLSDDRACLFGVSCDPSDAAGGRIAPAASGLRWFLDGDGAVSRLYGATEREAPLDGFRPHWLLLDRAQRVVACLSLAEAERALAALEHLAAAPAPDVPAPVLVVPGVLDVADCRSLIALHDDQGGRDSGFMREENGLTVERLDHSHKRRTDALIEDEGLKAALRARLNRALSPSVQRAFQWRPTRIERWLVACYDGETGGHFRAHRDNTTRGTAHRKFAVTVNLDADAYDGGDLCFPEFGPRLYRAPTGGAVVFSCSLLHEVRPVTRGQRYAFLPFLYDEEGARLRERNAAFLASPELSGYRARP